MTPKRNSIYCDDDSLVTFEDINISSDDMFSIAGISKLSKVISEIDSMYRNESICSMSLKSSKPSPPVSSMLPLNVESSSALKREDKQFFIYTRTKVICMKLYFQ